MDLLFLGDYCVCGPTTTRPTGELAAMLRAADVACVNFEGPVVVPGMRPAPKVGPSIGQPPSALEHCQDWGVTHLSLANNHIMDFGQAGLAATLSRLGGLSAFGAGLDFDAAYRSSQLGAANQRVALLAFAEAQFGVCRDESSHTGGYAWIDHPRARQAVREARAKADWVIVQVHAGLEMVGLPLPEWRQRYRELVDLGADLVIGHHPHVVQGSESYKGRMIYYSLGNLCMDAMFGETDPSSGAALRVSINDAGIKSEFLPLQIAAGKIDLDRSPAPLAAYSALCDTLVNSDAYYAQIQRICDEFWAQIYAGYYASALTGLGTSPTFHQAWRTIRRLVGSFLKNRHDRRANELMLIHNIRIETHRWVVERALADQAKQ
jgi:hypothetical protein